MPALISLPTYSFQDSFNYNFYYISSLSLWLRWDLREIYVLLKYFCPVWCTERIRQQLPVYSFGGGARKFFGKNVSNSEFPACKCTYFLAELLPPVILIFRSGKNLQIFFLRESQSLISSRFTIQFLPALPNVNSKLELGSLQKVYGYKIAGIFRNLLEKRQTFSNSRDSFKFFIRDGRVTCCFNDSCIAKQLRLSVSFIV